MSHQATGNIFPQRMQRQTSPLQKPADDLSRRRMGLRIFTVEYEDNARLQ
jgi:hypothetical protein